jgi:oxygen-dependent protoporphyrinogen oxidase
MNEGVRGEDGKPSVVVIGAGLSGLSTAWLLDRAGARVTVLEKTPRTGGAVVTDRVDGFLVEGGPNSMMLKTATAEGFVERIGLRDAIVPANPDATKRFLVKNGQVVAMPTSGMAAIKTPLYSWRAKLRLLKEPFVKPAPAELDESVASFVSRRMGREFLDYGIAALVSGIYAGDPEALSIRYAFPKVWNLEARYGSLIGGGLKLSRERRRSGEKSYKSQLISFADGMETLTRRLTDTTGAAIHTEATITGIEKAHSGWRIDWTGPDGPVRTHADALVVSVPGNEVANLPWPGDLAAASAGLPALRFPPVTTLALGYRRDQIAHPLDGFGMLIPFLEKRRVLGAIFSSTLFPGRAPDGCASIMIFLGGSKMPEYAHQELDDAVALAQGELKDLLGINGAPIFARHRYWPMAIPQYNVGHGEFLAALGKMESGSAGLHFCANYRGGPGLSDCLDSALGISERVSADLGLKPA